MGRRKSGEDPKVVALRAARCLNPRPQDVTDEAFGSQEFFDARDVVPRHSRSVSPCSPATV
jgi:hypothetical protein